MSSSSVIRYPKNLWLKIKKEVLIMENNDKQRFFDARLKMLLINAHMTRRYRYPYDNDDESYVFMSIKTKDHIGDNYHYREYICTEGDMKNKDPMNDWGVEISIGYEDRNEADLMKIIDYNLSKFEKMPNFNKKHQLMFDKIRNECIGLAIEDAFIFSCQRLFN